MGRASGDGGPFILRPIDKPRGVRQLRPMIRNAMLLAAGLAAAALAPAAAQHLHPPTAAEQRALDPMIAALTRILDRFGGPDWNKDADSWTGNPLVSDDPDVPLDIDQNFERTYRVRDGSARQRTVLQPLRARLTSATQSGDMSEAVRVGHRLRALSEVTVHVAINEAALSVDSANGGNAAVTLPGAALALRLRPDADADSMTAHYALAFGNWRTARWDGDNQAFAYTFVHRGHAAAIENVVLEIRGADDRIRELLRTLPWTDINTALTR